MVINFNEHDARTQPSIGTAFEGNVVVSDTDESGTNAVKNIVVLSQASYNALTPNSETLYFIT